MVDMKAQLGLPPSPLDTPCHSHDDLSTGSHSPTSVCGNGEKKSSQAAVRAAKSITLEELRTYFNKPIEEAARTIGICSTLLKKICRRYNIRRWPYRQVRSCIETM